MMVARPPVARRSGCELFRDHQVMLRAVPRGRASPLPLGAHLVANSVAIATMSSTTGPRHTRRRICRSKPKSVGIPSSG